jgi:iron complex outermembrane receptor protein
MAIDGASMRRRIEGNEMSNRYFKGGLLASTVIAGMVFAGPASAQDASNQPNTQSSPPTTTSGAPDPATTEQPAPVQNTNPGSTSEEIVVTGSLIRRTNAETPSPVTVLSAESLAQRGLNSVAEAVQRVSAGNAGTMTQGWNTGNNFASGANAVSLRGLTVQSTLTIFDGLRMAPYPLADDGQRNFVDLNSIPNAIIDRIEVLRDGASSTYGADAVAGVINVITKKEIQGLHLNGSAGISQRGDAAERRFDATYGYGDLDDKGFNFYVSAEYQKQEELWTRDRGFPYNTGDLSSICNDAGSCMSNLNWNGVSESGAYNGLISIPGVALVRPVSGTNPATGAGRFQFLNQGALCNGWDVVNPPAGASTGTTPLVNGVLTGCEVDFQNEYIMLQPEIERKGLSARFTFNIGDNHQLYAQGNWYRTDTFASFTPLGFNGTPTPPTSAGLAAYNVMLPVYVCPQGIGTPTGTNTGCTAANGVLNPYNPFAGAGQTAQMFFRSTRGRNVETHARALRGVLGLSGTILGDWNYDASFVASQVQLDRIQGNYYIPQRIADAVARGLFNFTNPQDTPEEVWDFIGPENNTRSTSDLWQATGTIGRSLFELPGGSAEFAGGLAYRHESIDAPSGNPGVEPGDNQYLRYYSINSVGTKGSRNVFSAFGEFGLPFHDMLEVNVSGRFDRYSTGQKAFSPKFGAKFTPVRELALRGTWSKGFRIPSFNESFGLPTTGYVTRGGGTFCTSYAAFCAAHGGNAYAANPFSVGLTQTGNTELDPERSTAMTFGAIFEPVRNVSFTVDLWKIKVKDLIVGVTDIGPVLDAYYGNNGAVNIPGFTVIPGAPDPAFPGATPHIGFIQSSYVNADSQEVSGIDIGANVKYNITPGLRLISSFEASYLHRNNLTPVDPITGEPGAKLKYAGTLSPCNVTSCSGAPKWRASWQNTFQFGNTTLSATAYFTKGVDLASVDFGETPGECENSVHYEDGSQVMCRSKNLWNVDFTASQKVSDRFTIYANVLNLLDTDAPFDHAAAYGAYNYNPSFAGANIMGRYFRVGAKVDF